MSDNISLSGITMGITDTPGNKKDHMINKIPVNNSEYLKRENSITSGVMNNQDIVGFESSNRERSNREK